MTGYGALQLVEDRNTDLSTFAFDLYDERWAVKADRPAASQDVHAEVRTCRGEISRLPLNVSRPPTVVWLAIQSLLTARAAARPWFRLGLERQHDACAGLHAVTPRPLLAGEVGVLNFVLACHHLVRDGAD